MGTAGTQGTLSPSVRQLRALVGQTSSSMVMFDRSMRFLAASATGAGWYGLDPDAIRGRVVYDAIPGFPPRWHEIHRRGLAGETCRCDLDLYVRPDGGSQWLRWIVTPWHLERGKIGKIIISFEDVERHAFEPYSSRRTDGAGTGIGLGLVKRAVEAAGGAVALESTVGIGTTVTMMLPFAV